MYFFFEIEIKAMKKGLDLVSKAKTTLLAFDLENTHQSQSL